jgi:starch phosphorylase
MIEEYTRLFYRPAAERRSALLADNGAAAKRMAEWRAALYKNWSSIKILSVEDKQSSDVSLGNEFDVQVKIRLGAVAPSDISVQIYRGYLDSKHRMSDAVVSPMTLVGKGADGGSYEFTGRLKGDRVGHCGYVIRVLPQFDGRTVILPGLVSWQ